MDARQSTEARHAQLPYPYNQDLSLVLKRLNRRTPLGRRRLANDPVTAAYIAAALRLTAQKLGPGWWLLVDPKYPESTDLTLFRFLSQRAVAAEVKNNPPPFRRVGRVSTLRERWKTQSDFIADVLRFGHWAGSDIDWVQPELIAEAVALLDRLFPPDPKRPLWRAFAEGLGKTFDALSGRRAQDSHTTLADDAHALCLVLGLTTESGQGDEEDPR